MIVEEWVKRVTNLLQDTHIETRVAARFVMWRMLHIPTIILAVQAPWDKLQQYGDEFIDVLRDSGYSEQMEQDGIGFAVAPISAL